MRIRSLGPLAQLIFLLVLTLVLATCGTNGTNSQSNNACSGCSFLYATTDANQILSFKLDSTGVLSAPVSSPGAANSPGIAGLLMFPPGGFLYASESNNNALDAFVVSQRDGTLAPVTGSPFTLGGTTGTPAGLLTFGNYLYAGDTNGTIAAFNITPTGALTPIPGSPFAAGSTPLHLVSAYTGSPSISLLYAADFTGGGIWAFTVGSNGGLTPVPGSPFATPANSAPSAMFAGGSAISGGILYVALSGLNQIAAFSISGSGALVPLPGSPFNAGRGPVSLFGFTSFLYAVNSFDHTISGYSMDLNTGVLTQVQGSPFPAGTASGGLINDTRNTQIFYAPDLQSSRILAFVADGSTGSLTPLPGSPFPTSVGPMAVTTVDFPVVDPH
jgi:6-phosphogluconolactonase (cycloisomerase 2 family)